MNVPGVVRVGPERRESTAEERKAYRLAHGETGTPKITMTPGFIATLIALLLGMGGATGISLKGNESNADHDTITAMAVELRMLKEDVKSLKADVQENNTLMRRVIYGRGDRTER